MSRKDLRRQRRRQRYDSRHRSQPHTSSSHSSSHPPRSKPGSTPSGHRSHEPTPGGVHGLARWISKLGLMSRSQAERCVAEGRVALNGKRITDPDRPCNPERDRIEVDGKPVRQARKVYLAMNKPCGHITTRSDPEGRPTVYELLPQGVGNVQAVGRLDAETSGLLIFTNDTELAARITDSSGGVEKVYEVRLEGRLEDQDALRFERGIELDGQITLPARVKILERDEASTLAEATITEGRNRQIRRMWEVLGHRVLTLERKRVGPISLGDLAPGKVRRVSEYERATLLIPRERP